MAIVPPTPSLDAKGRRLHAVLIDRLAALSALEQLSLGAALQNGSAWSALTPAARRALCQVAEDLGL